MKEAKMIYSDSLDEMVVAGFTKGKHHYTWDDLDCVYYNDDVDDECYMDLPTDCILD